MEFPHGSKEISFSIDDQQDDTKLHTSDGPTVPPVEKEHMFDKVVTPSDVGKLNRLVLPKQHAEKYFPLDSVANEKGLILCFEDCNGRPWCFRYSYWNSSQSYVITKGWSRFVKDHRLDTGDTVSFSRGRGDGAQDRLFIDCKHRQQPIPTTAGNQYHYPFLSINHSTLVPSGSRQDAAINHSTLVPSGSRQDAGSRRYVYLPSVAAAVPHASVQDEVLDSVPVVTRQAAAKRVRLFGVNLDCSESAAELQPKPILPQLQLALGSSSEEKQTPLDPGL